MRLRLRRRVVQCSLRAVLPIVPALLHAQSDTVRATDIGRNVQLSTGVDTSITYYLRGDERFKAMSYVEEVSRTAKGYLVVGRNVTPTGQVVSTDSIELSHATLQPLWHSDITPRGRMRVVFDGGRAVGTSTDSTGTKPVELPVADGAMDYSTMSMLMSKLPFRVGYSTVLVTHDIQRGNVFIPVKVLGEDVLEINGQRVPAWKVSVDLGRTQATRWFAKKDGRDLRTRVRAGALEMLAEPPEAIATPKTALPMLLPGSKDLVSNALIDQALHLRAVVTRPGDTTIRELGRVVRAEASDASNPVLMRLTNVWAAPSETDDTLLFRKTGLVPIRENLKVKGARIVLEYNGARVTGMMQRGDSAPRAIDRTFPQPLFGFNQLTTIVRSIPLRAGYHVVVPLYSEMDDAVEYDTLHVQKKVDRNGRPAWQVRFADPVVVITHIVDEATRQVVYEEVINRRNPASSIIYQEDKTAHKSP